MLLKLFVDDTFPFCDIKTAMTVNWIVQDNLPLNHPQNVDSILRAIAQPRRTDAGQPFGHTYVHASGRLIDVSRTAGDNRLLHGAVLTCSLTKPISANTPRGRSNTQYTSGSNSNNNNNNDDDDDHNNNNNNNRDGEDGESDTGGAGDSGSEAGDSPRNSRSNTNTTSNTNATNSNNAGGRARASSRGSSMGDGDEIYTAPECGWFPFVVSSGARRTQLLSLAPGGKKSASSGGGGKKPTPSQSDSETDGGSVAAAAAPAATITPSPKTESQQQQQQQQPEGSGNSATNTPRAGGSSSSSSVVGPSVKFNPRNVTSVRCMNAYDEPEPEDVEPRTFDLCGKCAELVTMGLQKAPENVLHVEKHYRPMMVDTETISVWLDKLGGGRISRWQRRWFMFTEKSIDWYESQPAVDQREKVKGSLMINVEGKFTIKRIVENPTPEEFPDIGKSGAGAYYFLLFVENAKRDKICYRAATEQDRKTVCQFLNKLKSRSEARGGNTRDPVFWKQWANSLLVSTSNMAELRVQKEEELKDINSDIKSMTSQIDGLHAGRDATRGQLEYQRGLVDRLEKELLAATRRNAELDRNAKEVRASVEQRRVELSHSLEKSQETSHRAKILEQEALSEKKRAIIALHEIRDENDRIQQRIDELFSKWRRVEEHHVEAAFRPSTLSPADIAARASRDYDVRAGISTSSGSGSGNVTNRSIGPMQPLTAETFGGSRTPNGKKDQASSPTCLSNYVPELSPGALATAEGGSSSRIQGSSLTSPNARLQEAVRGVLFPSHNNDDANRAGSKNVAKTVNVKEAAKQSGNRITFGISAALGYTPGSADALSSTRGSRRQV